LISIKKYDIVRKKAGGKHDKPQNRKRALERRWNGGCYYRPDLAAGGNQISQISGSKRIA
jgi:hypothetical protein